MGRFPEQSDSSQSSGRSIKPPRLVPHQAGEPLDISQMPTQRLTEEQKRNARGGSSSSPTTGELDPLTRLRKSLLKDVVEEGERLQKNLQEQIRRITGRDL